MKTKHQILIDRHIFRPIGWVLNFFVRLVGKVLFINHNLEREFSRIAICKFKGMGSIIQSTPMITALKKRYPNSEIIFVSTQQNKVLLEQISDIDTIVTINDKGFFNLFFSTIRALFFLIRKAPEIYIDLEIYSNFSPVFTVLTLSKNRIGFYLRSNSFRMGIYSHMMFFNPNVPISEVYFQISRLFGNQAEKPPLYPLYKNIPQGDLETNGKYIIVNPNASDLRIERRWDKLNFVGLIKKLSENNPDLIIYLIGSSGEANYTNLIQSDLSNYKNVISVAGKTSIPELISLIRHSQFMITNDTGPMHIAYACETPTISLFGPCSPKQYGFFDNSVIVYKPVYCSPCVHDFEIPPCKGNNTCMKLIEVEEVYQHALKLIQRTNKSESNTEQFIYTESSSVLGLVKRS